MMMDFIQIIDAWIDWASDPSNSNLVRTTVALIAVPSGLVGIYTFYKIIRGKHTDARVDRAAAKIDAQGRTLDEIKALVHRLASNSSGPAAPDRERAIADAVAAAQEGAAAGDARLQRALDLLKANRIAEAEALFQVVADDKASRIVQDTKDAAAAYRNLGAIAGLRDPKKALDAYERALEYDSDDLESLHWAGYLLIHRGNLDAAQTRLDRLLSLAGEGQSFYRFWAQLYVGDIHVERGDLAGALKSFREGRAIAERLARADPGNAGWQRDLSASYYRIGDVLVGHGNLAEALKSFRDGRAIAERLAQSDPGNAGWQCDLSVSYERIGDVPVAQGNLAEALKWLGDALAIAERLAQADPGNAGWQRDLSIRHIKIGDRLVAQGNLVEALKSFGDGLAIAERLAQADPGNAGWQRNLSVAHNFVGNVQLAQGDLAGAMKSYCDYLAIIERLAKSDPGNAGWQRDLSVSYDKIGNVLKAQGNLVEALKSFRDSLATRERLAQADPGNAGWQRDLSVSYNNVGDVLKAQGNLADALKSFRDSLAITERLAQADPGNAGWQFDLVASQWRLAANGDDAPGRFAFIVATLRKLKAENRLAPTQERWLPEAEAQLAKTR
jgi:tetratricopeptide (TPR) repeat protein